MIITTFAVLVLPVLIATVLRSQGIISGIVPLLVAGVAISFVISTMGAVIWKTRPGSGDLLFGDLIVWGFVRRWRVDRRLSSAAKLLGLHEHAPGEADHLTSTRKAELLEQLAGALEARDPYTHGHSRRVARHSATMAKRMGLSNEEIVKIRTAAAIHDVGKVETPREVLGKPGCLSDDEFEVIKQHPVDGARMAADLEDPELTKMVLHHHERLDGGGYPNGLRGDEIPLGARIIAVADTFDAITSARPYRPAKAHKMALDVLRAESESQLDRDVVEAFRGYYSGLRPVAVWAVITSLPQRLFTGLFDELGAGVASASKVMAATTASVVAGAGAVDTVGLTHPPASRASSKPAKTVLASRPGAQWHSGEALPGTANRPLVRPAGPRLRAGPRLSKTSHPSANPQSSDANPGGPASGGGPADGGSPPSEGIPPSEGGPPNEGDPPSEVRTPSEVSPPKLSPRKVSPPKEVKVPGEESPPKIKAPKEVRAPGEEGPPKVKPPKEVRAPGEGGPPKVKPPKEVRVPGEEGPPKVKPPKEVRAPGEEGPPSADDPAKGNGPRSGGGPLSAGERGP